MATNVSTRFSEFDEGAVSSLKSNKIGIPEKWSYTPSFDIHEPSIEDWLSGKVPGTQVNYTYYMDRFLAFEHDRLGFKTPYEFYEWAERQPKIKQIEHEMRRFVETQKPSQRPIAMSALKTYLEEAGFERRLPKVKSDVALKNHHRSARREEIIRWKSFLDNEFQKLFCDAAKDSGLRAMDLLSIRYRHLKPDLEAGLDYCHFYFEPAYFPPARKKKFAGITFIGPNTVKAIRDLIKAGKISTDPDARIFPFHYNTLADALRLARKKAGLDPRLQPCHALRKFFENALDRVAELDGGPPLDDVKKQELEGHSLGIRWNYRDQEVEALRPLYQRLYPLLDLSEQAAVDKKYKGLQDRITFLENENKQLKDMESRLETVETTLAAKINYRPR